MSAKFLVIPVGWTVIRQNARDATHAAVGGMLIEIMTIPVVPVQFCAVQEWKLKLGIQDESFEAST